MDSQLKVTLKAYAAEIGRPMTEIADQALAQYLGRRILEARWAARTAEGLPPKRVSHLKAIAALVLPACVEVEVFWQQYNAEILGLDWSPSEMNEDPLPRHPDFVFGVTVADEDGNKIHTQEIDTDTPGGDQELERLLQRYSPELGYTTTVKIARTNALARG